jgi:UDP-N-acetylglucosamine 2-epimerase (non-hydrolysing)
MHCRKGHLQFYQIQERSQKESSILNFRALNIRQAHERPEAMEEASVMMVGLSPERILQGLAQVLQQKVG